MVIYMISCLFEADASVTETNRKLYDIVVNPNDWNAHWIADINTERVLDTDPMAPRNWIQSPYSSGKKF